MSDDRSAYLQWADDRVRRSLAGGPPERSVGVMVMSVDGRAATGGKSGGLTSPADQALMRAWRAASDAIVVGTGTLKAERYGAILSADARATRVAAGRPPVPPLITLSRSGDVAFDDLVHEDRELEVVLYAPHPVAVPDDAPNARCVVVDDLSVEAVVAHARRELAGPLVVFEGGPKLLASSIAARLLTDVSLTVSPVFVGDAPSLLGEAPVEARARLGAGGIETQDDFVFLHYRLDRTDA